MEQSNRLHKELMNDLLDVVQKHSEIDVQEVLAVVAQLAGNLLSKQNLDDAPLFMFYNMVQGNIQLGLDHAIAFHRKQIQ